MAARQSDTEEHDRQHEEADNAFHLHPYPDFLDRIVLFTGVDKDAHKKAIDVGFSNCQPLVTDVRSIEQTLALDQLYAHLVNEHPKIAGMCGIWPNSLEGESRDVPLDDGAILTAKAMSAYLQTLAGGNTVVNSMIAGPTSPNVTLVGDADERQNEAENSANKAKLFPGGLPTNTDIIDLVVRIDAAHGSGKSLRKIALEFTHENRPKALSLLSQIRRLKREGKIKL